MNSSKIVYTVLLFSVLLLASCQKDDDNRSDAGALVTVVNNTDVPLPNIVVQMFDEDTYKDFQANNLTKPNEVAVTNSDGVASFHFSYDKWFGSQKDRVFMFAVQNGGGMENYQIWAAGSSIHPGDNIKIRLKLDGLEQ